MPRWLKELHSQVPGLNPTEMRFIYLKIKLTSCRTAALSAELESGHG